MTGLSPAALAEVIRTTLATPDFAPDLDGKRGAFVTVADATGVHAAIVSRVGQYWTVSAAVQHTWNSPGVQAGVTLHASW